MRNAPKRILEQDPGEGVLLRRLQVGDEEAFEHLDRTHGQRLLAVARRILGNEEDARDAVQEALLSAVRAMTRFSGKSRLGTWLYRIVVNSCLMMLRRGRIRPERFLEDVPVARDVPNAQLDTAAERRETCIAVLAGIDRLPRNYRDVLKMRAIDGVGARETARSLGVTLNTVKTRLHRAKRALRAELEPRFGLARAG